MVITDRNIFGLKDGKWNNLYQSDMKQIVIHQLSEEEKRILTASNEARKGKNVTKAMTGKAAIDYLKKLQEAQPSV